MAHILGIVASEGLDVAAKKNSFTAAIADNLKASLDEGRTNRAGALVALGYMISRTMYRHPSTFTRFVDEQTLSGITESFLKALESEVPSIRIAGCMATAELGRYAPIPDSIHSTLLNIQTKLESFVKSVAEPKTQEAAIFALSQISLGNPKLLDRTLEFMFELPSLLSKQIELHFNIGEALCAALFGFEADNMKQYLDISNLSMTVVSSAPATTIQDAFLKILGMLGSTQNAVTKRAACVWLLCCVKFCGKCQLVSSRLLPIHDSFAGLLGDRDEFTQDVASKGIGLVYELGDKSIKEECVKALVSTFTDGKKIAPQSISSNTQVFDAAVLGSTPEGGNLGTYQSILSLAADMNQPDLVYKFMSLASHHAIWNSRRGASMGFSSIATQAQAELAPHLPELIPRLYRYQFDPHPKTAEGMKNIWSTIVKDHGKTVEKYFAQIVTELLKGMGDRAWRTREASCSALADILQGRQIEETEPFLTQLWTMSFRALDDIKESVRQSAFRSCKTITNMTVRYCDPILFSPKRSQKIMDEMIPFLLNQGLGNMAEEVRKFSLAAILKLSKTGGVLLKPHVSIIIATLLECLSSLEPQSLNYLSFHTAAYNITQEQLDSARLSSAKTSPMMDAIDQCVQQIDTDTLRDLCSRLCTIIRKGVGLPTRAGTCRFIYTLVQRVPNDLRPYADDLLKALSGALNDRSPVVRKSFCTAVGHLVKLASPGALDKFAGFIKTKYLEANDEEGRSVAPIVYLEMSRHSASAVADIHAIILPLAFMGARDLTYPSLAEIWAKVWEENTAGSNSAIKKWKSELIESCSSVLISSPSWSMKRQVGKALTDIAKALGEDIVPIMPECLKLLVDALSGRTWEGKEALLEALAHVSIEGKSFFIKYPNDLKTIEDVFIREAKKNNKMYRRLSIEYMGLAFAELKVDRYSDVEEYLMSIASGSEDEDEDMDEDALQKPLILATQANAFIALGKCFPHCAPNQGVHGSKYLGFISEHLSSHVWNVRVSILQSLESVVKKANGTPLRHISSPEVVANICEGLKACLGDMKYRTVRDHAANTVFSMAKNSMEDISVILAVLPALIEAERDAAIQSVLKSIKN